MQQAGFDFFEYNIVAWEMYNVKQFCSFKWPNSGLFLWNWNAWHHVKPDHLP